MANIAVTLKQHDATASIATIRDHQIVMDRPEEKCGNNLGPMGGEAMLASLGGCFMSNLRAAIAARKDAAVDEIELKLRPHWLSIRSVFLLSICGLQLTPMPRNCKNW